MTDRTNFFYVNKSVLLTDPLYTKLSIYEYRHIIYIFFLTISGRCARVLANVFKNIFSCLICSLTIFDLIESIASGLSEYLHFC